MDSQKAHGDPIAHRIDEEAERACRSGVGSPAKLGAVREIPAEYVTQAILHTGESLGPHGFSQLDKPESMLQTEAEALPQGQDYLLTGNPLATDVDVLSATPLDGAVVSSPGPPDSADMFAAQARAPVRSQFQRKKTQSDYFKQQLNDDDVSALAGRDLHQEMSVKENNYTQGGALS